MEIKIIIDDENIQMNDFVQEIIGNMISGAVTSLKKTNEDWSNITITLKKEDIDC
ncbi:MAG: hypothetical protein HF967_07200 [Methanosarcinales archaeon]|jgi:hypothetical protein|nr:hypothetical protein [Methanosarcinales archaeon]